MLIDAPTHRLIEKRLRRHFVEQIGHVGDVCAPRTDDERCAYGREREKQNKNASQTGRVDVDFQLAGAAGGRALEQQTDSRPTMATTHT